MNTEILKEFREWEKNEAIQTLKECGMTEGMAVMDFGCSVPHYTLPASQIAGETGVIYAADKNKRIVELVQKHTESENITNIKAIQLNDKTIKKFKEPLQFILYYDMFHCVGKGMNGRLVENEKLFREFNRLLTDNGIFSFAVYWEVTSVQDFINGPFTPKGEPKWLFVPYEEAFNEHYKFVPFIEACGFKLKNIVKGGGVHFDEIDFKLNSDKNKEMRFSDLERRDIYNFIKS